MAYLQYVCRNTTKGGLYAIEKYIDESCTHNRFKDLPEFSYAEWGGAS